MKKLLLALLITTSPANADVVMDMADHFAMCGGIYAAISEGITGEKRVKYMAGMSKSAMRAASVAARRGYKNSDEWAKDQRDLYRDRFLAEWASHDSVAAVNTTMDKCEATYEVQLDVTKLWYDSFFIGRIGRVFE